LPFTERETSTAYGHPSIQAGLIKMLAEHLVREIKAHLVSWSDPSLRVFLALHAGQIGLLFRSLFPINCASGFSKWQSRGHGALPEVFLAAASRLAA
jgi:hypothetical protein